MIDFLNVLMIAVALSMDTFSLSLGIGTYNISRKKCLQISMTVGIMHFIMPYLGDMIGDKIVSFFALNSNLFLGCILYWSRFISNHQEQSISHAYLFYRKFSIYHVRFSHW